MAQRPLTSEEIINTIKSAYLVPLTIVAGRARYTSDGIAGTLAGGGAAVAGIGNDMRNDWNVNQFVSLARFNGTTADIPANAGRYPGGPAGVIGGVAVPAGPPLGQIPPLTGANWDNYIHNDYQRIRYALGAGVLGGYQNRAARANAAAGAANFVAVAPIPANLQKEAVRVAVIDTDLRIPGGAGPNALINVMNNIFNGDWTINPKTNKAIFNVPKSDELLRRCVSVLFAKSSGLDVEVPAAATVNQMANAMVTTISGPFFNNMPKSDSDMYIALLGLNKEDRESLARYDERVDLIREALSQGQTPGVSTGIQPGNIVPNPVLNSVSVFSAYPAGLQEALRQRRKSDPSAANPAATLNRIRISMNGGTNNNNLVGGSSSASRALPLYPRLVMSNGGHPFAVMEGGAWPMGGPAAPAPAAWPNSRATPNPVAALDSRIKQLESEFHRATGQNLGSLSGQIRGYADNLNTAMTNLQKDLETLSNANKALSQISPGLGIDISNATIQQLQDITGQADKINKDAARTSKQLDKLTQIKDSLEQLVIQSSPAPRT